MANIEIGGRLHSTATGNVVTGANEVLDDTKNKKQSVINAEVDETIGDDNTAGTIKGRIKTAEGKLDTLNGDSSTSGSVAKAVADAKTELIGGATSNGNTLKKVEDRTATLETAVGSNGSVDQRIANAVNTEKERAQGVEATKADKSDTYTKSETYTKTEVDNIASAFTSQKYVTVEAISSTTAATDVLPSSGQATDTIYRVANWDGSTYNTTCYAEYTWNGTAYVLMDVKNVGIDDEPTAGSDNLVKSGGVYEEVSQLGQELGYFTGNPISFETFRDIGDGKWRTGIMNTSFIVPIKGAKSVSWVTGSDGTYYSLLSDYQTPSNGDTPSFATGYSDRVYEEGQNHSLSNIPANAKYLYLFCGYYGTTGSRPTSVIVDGIEMLNQSWVAETILEQTNKLEQLENKKGSIIRLTWQGSFSLTVLQIAESDRYIGMFISYNMGDKQTMVKQYFGNFISDAYFEEEISWVDMSNEHLEDEILKATMYANGIPQSLVKYWFKGYFQNGGVYSFTTGHSISDYIPVVAGQTYYIRAYGDSETTPVGVCYDSNKNVVSIIGNDSFQDYYTIPTGVSYIRIGKSNHNETKMFAGVWSDVPLNGLPISICKKFSEQGGELYYDGQPITAGQISTLVVDLPVSDGTDIESGYAYIDITNRTIKVKA